MEGTVGFLAREHLQALIDLLHGRGYRCLGPQVRDGAIVLDVLESVDTLPRGVRDVQAPGRYRLERVDDERLFAWANPAQGLRPLAFRPREALDAGGFRRVDETDHRAFVLDFFTRVRSAVQAEGVQRRAHHRPCHRRFFNRCL